MSNPPETPLLSALQQASQRCAEIRASYRTSGIFDKGTLAEVKELEGWIAEHWPLRRLEIVRKRYPEGEVQHARLEHVRAKERTVRHGNKPLSDEIAWLSHKEEQPA